jgi:PAS domain S-box-containing protein
MEPEKRQSQMIEEALRESAEPDRELFENSKDAMYVHNLSGIYTSVNRAAEQLSGYSRDEIIGQPFWKFVAPEYVKQARAYLCQKLEEVGETKYELEIIKKGGRRVPVEVTSRIIRDKGVPVGVQGAARDISERRRVQQAVQRYSRLIRVRQVGRQDIGREKHDTTSWDDSLRPKKE